MIKRRRRSRKWIWWLVFLVLLITTVIVCFLVREKHYSDKKDGEEVSGSSLVKQQNDISKESDEGNEEEIKTSDEKRVVQYEGDSPNEVNELSGAITYARVQDGLLIIRVNIDQYLENGECELTLKRDNDIIFSDIVSIIGGASTATCEGFDVPAGELGGGSVRIIVRLNANGKTGSIRGEVSI